MPEPPPSSEEPERDPLRPEDLAPELDPIPAGDAWDLARPHPVTLVAMWPGDDAPTRTEVLASLRGVVGGEGEIEIVDELESASDDVLWNVVAAVPGLDSRVILWAEPAKPLDPDEMDAPEVMACRWVVGAELLLSREAPLADFHRAVRMLASLDESVPAVYDVNTGQWHLRRSLETSFLDPETEPPDEAMWVVHAVTGGGQPADAATVWLYTAGLWRCGRPELEMLEVPGRHVHAAVAMINAIAGLALEEPLPPPGEPFEVGNELRVVLQPWREVVRYLDPSAYGSLADRGATDDPEADEENPLAGVRAVVCAERPTGAYKPIWTWPSEAIARIESDNGTLYQTRSATRRQRRLAQRLLPEFAMAFASLVNDGIDLGDDEAPSFFAKVGFPSDDGASDDHEHLWFRVVGLDGPRMEGLLLNPPHLVASMRPGDRAWFDQGQVSWWQVVVGERGYGPEVAPAMTEAVDTYRAGRGGDA